MDCESCTDRLVDLLEEAVDASDAEALRGHLASCASCSAALERLKAGRELASFLVLEEPPSAVRASVLAAARERAAGRASLKPDLAVDRPTHAAAREAHRPEERRPDEDTGLWASLMRWLGGFAMGPQVAMSMMLILMVGIGLWYLPELRRNDPADTHAIVDPATADEAGPSGALAPAEPLALDADPRTGRIRPREEEEAAVRADGTELRAETRAPAAERAQDAPLPSPDVPARELLAEGGEGSTELVAEAPQAPAEAQMAADSVESETVMPTAPSPPIAERRPLAVAPQPTAPSAPVAPMPTQATRVAAPVEESTAEMVRRPETDTRPLLPGALHQLARNQVRDVGCGTAIGSYEQLVARHPSYPALHEARLELADCYRRTGQVSRARALLEQAAQDPRVASRAQRELVRLEAAERAMNRTAETNRTPDRAPPPAAAAEQAAPHD